MRIQLHCLHYLTFLFFVWSQSTFAQQPIQRYEELFVRILTERIDSLSYVVDPADERLSHRLGIQYEGVKNKYLISYELNPLIRQSLQQRSCLVRWDTLGDSFSRVTFSLSDHSITQQYYFHSGKFIAPFTYFTHRWKKIVSQYFVFIVSDSLLFNEYSAQALERFTDTMMDTLDYSVHDRDVLSKEKIYYVLCRDENEIEQVTGYKTRGIYNLAYDMIVTTYNCHYHELAHLLMNYKLKTLPLYSLPILQEGFAVAFGGRGGYEPDVLLHTGAYLQHSGFADEHDLFSRQGFMQTDASISYPLSGLYVGHLFRLWGIQKFCELYRHYSGTDAQVDTMVYRDDSVSHSWTETVQAYISSPMISFSANTKAFPLQTSGIQHDSKCWYVCFKDTLLVPSKEPHAVRFSKKFKELFPSRTYRGEQYVFIASDAELSVYNLFTGNLIANYVRSFSTTPLPIIDVDGYTRCMLPIGSLCH